MSRRLHRLLLIAVVAAASLVAPDPARADTGTMLDVSTSCDPTTETVTTAASGRGYVPHANLQVVFRTVGGGYASSEAGSGPLPSQPPVTVPATTDATGRWSIATTVRPWAAPGDLFYSEQLRVSVVNADTGAEVTWRSHVCYHDRRTTVTFACDPETGTIDVHVAGVRYGEHSSVRVRYYKVRTWSQATADSPVWVGSPLGFPPPTRSLTVPVAADGGWSDPGIQQAMSSSYYYGATEYLVVVTSPYNEYELGRGEGVCVWSDQRPA